MPGEPPEAHEITDGGGPDASSSAEIDPASFLGPATNPASGVAAAAPILLFVVINARFFIFDDVGSDRWWFGAAVAASVSWSIASVMRRRSQGLPTGRFVPIVTAWLVIRGLVGIMTGNEDVFFGMSIAAKVVIGIVLIGSVLIGRSIAGLGAPFIFGFSDEVQAHDSYISAMAHVTLLGAAYEFASAAFDVWLLFIRDASANQFVIVRYIANWGASTLTLFAAFAYLGHRLNEIEGFPGVMRIFEAHVEATANRLGWDLSE